MYALSTGPGAPYQNVPDQVFPKAVYTLAEDGTWQPLVLDGDRPRLIEMAGAGGQLYGVTTGPGDGAGEDGPPVRLGRRAARRGPARTSRRPAAQHHPPLESLDVHGRREQRHHHAGPRLDVVLPRPRRGVPGAGPGGRRAVPFSVEVGAEGLTLRRLVVDDGRRR